MLWCVTNYLTFVLLYKQHFNELNIRNGCMCLRRLKNYNTSKPLYVYTFFYNMLNRIYYILLKYVYIILLQNKTFESCLWLAKNVINILYRSIFIQCWILLLENIFMSNSQWSHIHPFFLSECQNWINLRGNDTCVQSTVQTGPS